MDTLDDLRNQLLKRKGLWKAIADEAGLDRATVRRILYVADYSPTLRTINKLKAAMYSIRPRRQK